jgi:hypothetical protein
VARDRRGDRLSPEQQVEFAWKAHEANAGCVLNVDQNVSIVLVLATALTGLSWQQRLAWTPCRC